MLCTPCELELYEEPPLDDLGTMLKVDRDLLEPITCTRCGATDIRIKQLARPDPAVPSEDAERDGPPGS